MADKEKKVSREEAIHAIETIIKYIGDDPSREGLQETPKRVLNTYKEYFSGYCKDPKNYLDKTFDLGSDKYKEMVIVRDIKISSHCEHHMVPFHGVAHVAYIPDKKVVGLSKLARVVDGYARRLQTQEVMTLQIANAIEEVLSPEGVAVIVKAKHECMTGRGISSGNSKTITTQFRGKFRECNLTRTELLSLVGNV